VPEAVEFIREAYKHCKTLGGNSDGADFIRTGLELETTPEEGLILDDDAPAKQIATAFIDAMSKHRHWSREKRFNS
jgi:catalase